MRKKKMGKGEMARSFLDISIFFLVSMCSEVEIFLFVFFELCLGSYGEPMLTGLYCNVVYLSLSSSLFIYICIHWFYFCLLFIFVYIGFIFVCHFCIYSFFISQCKYLTFILVFMCIYLVSVNFYCCCAYHCSYLFILCQENL